MQEGILAETLDWSAGQPGWQRDALRRLFTAGPLGAADLDDLLDLCKSKHGLSKARTPKPLAGEHLAIGDAAAAVSLASVTHHRGVNALAPEQTVAFGPHLTVVYGQNAAGKSGYIRILKRACRSRFAEDILGNVLSEGAPLKGKATIRFRVGDDDQTIAWRPDAAPSGALAAVSVFDAQCAPVYLREKTDVAFRPFSLDVFDRLSNACAEVQKHLKSEQTLLSSVTPALPKAPEGTRVAAFVASLTALTNPDDVRALGTLSARENDRLKALRAQQRDLQASDPRKRGQELELKASRIEGVASHLADLAKTFGNAGVEAVRSSAARLEAARTALTHLRKTVLTPNLLPGTGEEAWRRMWEAAGEFSGFAYPEKDFPVVSTKAKCLFCQQPLGADAASRFRHFQELVSSTAQADVRSAEIAHGSRLETIRNAVVEREDLTLAIDEIQADDGTLAERAQTFLTEVRGTKEAIGRANSQQKPLPLEGVQGCPDADLRSAAKALRERSAQLRKQSPTMDAKDATELTELEARVALKDQLQPVLDEIERRKRIAAYSLCLEDTNTLPITRKSTDLTKRLVTERLREGFQAELLKAEFTHLAVEIKAAGGAKGDLFHQLAFTNAPGVAVAKVLSEGESRTLSLAAFLTELRTSPAPSAIIFDDPVSSLDHIWRERIARRLVGESKARQVIVFTHDLVFLKLLLDECERQVATCHHQYVHRDGESSGICSADLPWVAMPVKDRLGVLRVRSQAAAKLSRTTGGEPYEREARDIYGLLRETWEQAVSEVLLNDVVEPYRPSVETKKVRHLHDITEEDCRAVEEGMTECSRWLHNRPRADDAPLPTPAQLSKHIEDLAAWVQRIRKRREGQKRS